MTRRLTNADVRAIAEAAEVCVRPILSRVTDTTSGETRIVGMDCKSTQAAVCPACAERARRVRMQQCREGWHRDDEPDLDPSVPDDADCLDVLDDQDVDSDDDADDELEEGGRRHRSTRRRDDVADLPRVPMEARTVGVTFTGHDGRQYRPSMFITLTLPSYGQVRSDGTPTRPAEYDYRRAAWDAMTFGRLLDRFFQNLRRCAGYEVQYFAAVEPQRRGAPHVHIAVRGALPRALVKALAAATYTQIWWPSCGVESYGEGAWPVWDHTRASFIDKNTGAALSSWAEAMTRLDDDPDARPAHMARFSSQVDMQGLIGGTDGADRAIRYLTKYLAKSMSAPMTNADDDELGDPAETARRRVHAERLHEHTSRLPCSPSCANWLRYGIQPRGADAGTTPGRCRSKTHLITHLGYGGRRVLVSRKWSGKTLAAHRADRAAVVRAVLEAAGVNPDDHAELSATAPDTGTARFHWTRIAPGEADAPTYQRAIATSIRRRHRWRAEYQRAKDAVATPAPSPTTSLLVGLGSGVKGERSESTGHEVPLTPGPRATSSPVGDGTANHIRQSERA